MAESARPRPRLAEHVAVRRYLRSDGSMKVVLHDRLRGSVHVIGSTEWNVLGGADGTRDVEGLRLYAKDRGVEVETATLEVLVDRLRDDQLLADASSPSLRASVPAAPPSDRPLDVLPDFTLVCDGNGTCCTVLSSAVLNPEDLVAARRALPVLDVPDPLAVLTPAHGSVPQGLYAVPVRAGACGFLTEERRCAIHAVGGPQAKPLGCRSFPATFADDGEAVRVSVAFECACVEASVGRSDGASLLDAEVRTRADIPAAAGVRGLPDRVALSRGTEVSLAELRGFRSAMLAAPSPRDVAGALWGTAARVSKGGLAQGLDDADAPAATEVRPWVAALLARCDARLQVDAQWRDPRDEILAACRAVRQGCVDLLEREDLTPRKGDGAIEAAYLRAIVHGYRVLSVHGLVAGLRDCAVRLWVARALTHVERPIAIVESLLRAHGLGGYVADVL